MHVTTRSTQVKGCIIHSDSHSPRVNLRSFKSHVVSITGNCHSCNTSKWGDCSNPEATQLLSFPQGPSWWQNKPPPHWHKWQFSCNFPHSNYFDFWVPVGLSQPKYLLVLIRCCLFQSRCTTPKSVVISWPKKTGNGFFAFSSNDAMQLLIGSYLQRREWRETIRKTKQLLGVSWGTIFCAIGK